MGQLGRGSCRTFTDALHFIRSCPPENDPLDFIFGDLVKAFTDDETKILCALSYFTCPAKVEHVVAIAGVEKATTESALRSLANRSLVVPDQEEKSFVLVSMVSEFIQRQRPDIIKVTGIWLEERAYALIGENGYEAHDRFSNLEAAWPSVAPALPRFLAGSNDRIRTVCHALFTFLNFTGRRDEWVALNQQGETKALAAGDYDHAGWRAYHAGTTHVFREEADAVLACADRARTHWDRAFPQGDSEQNGVRERAIAIQLRGYGHRLKENYPAAIAAHCESIELFRSLSPESADVGTALNDLASAEQLAGDFVAAAQHYRDALRAARASDNDEGVAIYTSNLALLAFYQKDWPSAEALAREALPLAEKVGHQELIGGNCQHLAEALFQQGKGKEGLPHAQRAVKILTLNRSPRLEGANIALRNCEQAGGTT